MESEFKVWCKDKKEWEKDLCVLTPNGGLLTEYKGRFIPLGKENHEAVFWTGLRDTTRSNEYPEGQKIYNGSIVKIITNEETGEIKHGSGRKSYTVSKREDIESIGVVKHGKSNYPYESVSLYYVDTNKIIEYGTYFYANKPSDGATLIKHTIRKPLELIKNIEVIGHILKNPELLEVE